ncbi:MAG: hypothetical protein GWP19_12635, partial [Planctomycetia bacterium]|nr:hypothetical protein [Planctomycetia bacterium]
MVIGIKVNPILMIGIPLLIIVLIWLLNNPGISLLFLALTGIIKGFLEVISPVFEIIDYTLLFTIIIWIGLLRLYIVGKAKIPEWAQSILISYILFCTFLFFSGFYSPSPNYGWQKVFRFIVFNTTMFITPLIIINTIGDSKRILLWFRNILIVIVVIMTGYILYYLAISSGISFLIRVSILGANPITVGSFLAIGAGMMVILINRSSYKNWILYIPILGILIVAIIATGSRGPLLSFLFGVLLFGIFFEKVNQKQLLLFFLFSVVFLVIALQVLPENLTGRYLNYTTGDLVIQREGVKRLSTIAMRLQYWELSISEWLRNIKTVLVGVGSGGFSSFYILRDYKFYPHNMFVEVLLEMGLIGLSVLILFWYKIARIL